MSHVVVLLLGALVGAAIILLSGGQSRQQKRERLALKQRQEQLEHCYHDLASHCSKNIVLLERLTEEYRMLYQQLVANTQTLLTEQRWYRSADSSEVRKITEPTLIKAEAPCDYSSTASNLLRPEEPRSID